MQTESPEWLRNEAARLEAIARESTDWKVFAAYMMESETLRKRAAYIENQQK